MRLATAALLLAVAAPTTAQLPSPSRRPIAAALRNCSLIPPADAKLFAFTADGAKLRWQADPSQCLTPSPVAGPNATGVQLRDCEGGGTDWTRVPAAPANRTVLPDGFFLAPTSNRSLCARAQPNFGAALLLPCNADPWNTDPWHFTPINDSRVYCPQRGGTVWTLTPAGQLRAAMSNPFLVGSDPAVCSHFQGCLGAAAPPASRATIRPLRWKPVPLSVPLRPRPGSWMHLQLLAQANGFGGHEYPFADSNPQERGQDRYYPFANSSGSVNNVENDIWLGGNFIGSANLLLSETYPYWLNGFVPLVALLNDTEYIAALAHQVDHVLSQAADQGGWLGPLFEESRPLLTARGALDFWQVYRMMGALCQYAELAPSNSSAVVDGLLKFADALDTFLADHPIVIGDWSHMRMTELLAPLLWLTDHAPASADLSPVLSLMGKVYTQGMDWTSWILSPSFGGLTAQDPGNLCGPVYFEQLMVHGVDVGTSLMQQAHNYRVTGDNSSFARARRQLDTVMAYHGQASGVFSAGECLCGRKPDAGTETCAVVETMESLGQLFTVTGEIAYLDQLERVAFNALPAAFFNGSMGAMQYFQHANTDFSRPDQLRYMQVFECCLANHNQGWPKYAQRAVMTATEDWGDTLAVLLYHSFDATSVVLPSGSTANVSVSTAYPFNDTVAINITPSASLTLALRIPGWCTPPRTAANISEICRVERTFCDQANGCRDRTDPCGGGDLFRTVLDAGKQQRLRLVLPMSVRLENRTQNATAVSRGPLLYSYNVPWASSMDTQCNASGLFPDAFATPDGRFTCDVTINRTQPLPPLNVSSDSAFTFRAKPAAAPLPGQGVFSSFLTPVELEVSGGAANFTMIPYGSTDLRITELPPTRNEA